MNSQCFHLREEEAAPRRPPGEPRLARPHDPSEQFQPRTLEKWPQRVTAQGLWNHFMLLPMTPSLERLLCPG